MGSVHISVGAGFENDRRDLGVKAAQALSSMDSVGDDPNAPRYLIFECLAERTLAKQVLANSLSGQIRLALSHIEPSRELCKRHKIRVVTNLGGIDPVGVAKGLKKVFANCVIAAVTGDKLPVRREDGDNVLAKNCYTGAKGIVSALEQGADIVVTGRVSDPSLVVGPVVHELGLEWTDWDALANATLAGHLIECGTQVSGGYFSDENVDVPELENVGPPVATVTESMLRLSKPIGGGLISRATVIEQMLYEIADPGCYITPDVILDLSQVEVDVLEQSIVELTGATGHSAPAELKALLCRQTGWFAEGGIIYQGITSEYRANMAKNILIKRIDAADGRYEVLHGHLEGVPQTHLRVALRSSCKSVVEHAMNEIEALYLNGPAAGGGVSIHMVPQIETEESTVLRQEVETENAILVT